MKVKFIITGEYEADADQYENWKRFSNPEWREDNKITRDAFFRFLLEQNAGKVFGSHTCTLGSVVAYTDYEPPPGVQDYDDDDDSLPSQFVVGQRVRTTRRYHGKDREGVVSETWSSNSVKVLLEGNKKRSTFSDDELEALDYPPMTEVLEDF